MAPNEPLAVQHHKFEHDGFGCECPCGYHRPGAFCHIGTGFETEGKTNDEDGDGLR